MSKLFHQSASSRLAMKQPHCQQKMASTKYTKITNFNFRLSTCCRTHSNTNTTNHQTHSRSCALQPSYRWRNAHPAVCFQGAVSGPPFGRAHTVPRPHVLRWPGLNRCCPGGRVKGESWPKIAPKETISSFSSGKYQ